MQVIYHSRGAYPARLAAAIHLGLLPAVPPADLEGALAQVGGLGALEPEGLWRPGTDAAGYEVIALGLASRPEVTQRAFASIGGLAGIDPAGYRLRSIGPVIAWDDMWVKVLTMAGLRGLARRKLMRGLKRHWPEAARAAAEAQSQPTLPPAPPATPPATDQVYRIIYHCYGGAHSSVTAANIHLGRLPLNRRPGPHEIVGQPRFDRAKSSEVGLTRHLGDDEWGNRIYVMGMAGGRHQLREGLLDFLRGWGAPADRFRFEATLPHAGVLLRIGGYSSRGLGWVAFGRPLCALGVWLKYPLFASHVRRVRQELSLTGPAVSDIIG